jgi:hypothetical protein
VQGAGCRVVWGAGRTGGVAALTLGSSWRSAAVVIEINRSPCLAVARPCAPRVASDRLGRGRTAPYSR